MSKLLAVVALIATSNASFVEFSEDAFQMFNSENAQGSGNAVTVINSDREFKFHLPTDEAHEEDVHLYSDQLPGSAHEGVHPICGTELGIHIEGIGTFCTASLFHVGIDRVEQSSSDSVDVPLASSKRLDQKIMQFSIYFKSGRKTQPCLLEIPIFQIPSKVASSNSDQLETWATDNKVGLLSQEYVQKMTAVRRNRGLTTDFKWLSDVLKYGVFKTQCTFEHPSTPKDLTAYNSRPIVLSDEDLMHFTAWIGGVYYVHTYKK